MQKSLTMCDCIISARNSSWKDVLIKLDESSVAELRVPAGTYRDMHLYTNTTFEYILLLLLKRKTLFVQC